MENIHTYEHYRSIVNPALASKIEEFRLLGNETITEGELWHFLIRKKWKKDKGEKLLHDIVSDIMSVKSSDYISYATMEAYKGPAFSFDNKEDWQELLK